MLSEIIQHKKEQKKKLFALLIDPDKFDQKFYFDLLIKLSDCKPDVILVGGSLLFHDINITIQAIKKLTPIPVYIFPGNSMQVSAHADGILFTSLISGRNPEFLIGNQVNAAPIIKKYKLDTFATGYVLVESNNNTAVRYMSNTMPIPRDKIDIAIATALAGEMLGLKAIYLEAGSGATNPVPSEMISGVKSYLNIPIIVGGGIRSTKDIEKVYEAGADIIVIGNAFEKNEFNIEAFKATMKKFL